MIIYLSGRITGNDNYIAEFKHAEYELWKQANIIVSPLDYIPLENWKDYMRRDLNLIKGCKAIYMIKGWETSRGANIELWFARRYGLTVIFQK
jgi:hypothetical protein